MLKKFLCLVLVLMFSVSLVACGGTDDSSKKSDNANQETKKDEKSDKPVEAKPVVLKLAHGQPIEGAAHQSLMKMAEEVSEKTNGQVVIEIFPANQLGNERDVTEGIILGTVDMAWISVGVMENFEPKFSIFSLPFMFNDYEHVHKVTEGEVGSEIFGSLLDSKKLRVLQFFDQGFRFIWNNKGPIESMEDLAGLKIRTPESPVYVGTFDALGANPTPIPWGELYTSMQTKVVEGFEVYPESVIANKMYEVVKYGSISRHIYAGSVLMINEDVHSKLTSEQQEILKTAADNSELMNRDMITSNEVKFIEELKTKYDVDVNEIPQEELDKFAESVKPLYEEYADKVGGIEIINKLKATK
ncbi:TRAP transporter substrate-binding protein [Vallitalea guaymasensis]|uniref:TRAP transporter substrate-binding protein n=1 Tax=Vallitalea guaymasensis TaxID=1185412 RepID=UPI0023537BC2|nr:TRAP transporter substrate-binding protein [Vallitalea guaymasensis]